ncbi:PAS domain S-box protein [Leptospira haakeii]|uniref:histidine kinase n=1 Tax=Leptospira haakeii TaxID=2023198 RepID=A0ABX4PJ65_9LEPT|nr:PAS domain S-box protein [Leptospira haakeii]PKA15837.1 histidine kinase [Leptospira haakeii]PKA19356.1 histidine kinase [Leptospira haakeii]
MSSGKSNKPSEQAVPDQNPETNLQTSSVLDHIPDAFILADREWNLTYVNEKAEEIIRRPKESLIGKNLLRDFPRLFGTEFEAQYKKAKETGVSSVFETFFGPFNSWIEVRIYPNPEGFLVYYLDITQRKKKEISWAIGESLLWDISTSDTLSSAFGKVLKTLIKNTAWTYGQIWRSKDNTVYINEEDPYVYDSDLQLLFRKESINKFFSTKEGILKKVSESGELYFIPDLVTDKELKRKDAAIAAGFRSWIGIPILSHGRFYEIELLSERVLNPEEAYLDLLGVVSKRFAEIVSRRVADEERKTLIAFSSEIILTIGLDCTIRETNPAFQKILGYERKYVKNKSLLEFIHPDDVERTKAKIASGVREGFENRYITKYGQVRFIYWHISHSHESGTVFCFGRDITEDRLTIQKLESFADQLNVNREQLYNAQKLAKMGSWTMEFDGTISWSPGLFEIFGLEPSDSPPGFEDFIQFIPQDDRGRIIQNYEKFLSQGIFEETELRIVSKDGTEKFLSVKGEGLLNRKGEFIGGTGTMQDITEEKEWNAYLRQFQKMEAVGQLAGGMAHDFNNLLNIILANLDLLELNLREAPELLKRVFSAQDAVRRGVELNRRILAFSRKQALNPEQADVSNVISDFADILTRIRNDIISIEFCLEDFPMICSFEKNGLENALLNLCLNSRDAMPHGGKILVSTGFSPAGKEHRSMIPGFVEMEDACIISVRDEGSGMDAKVLERLFEPFFTTKQSGKGTGLGMPMVYGFVKQSNGMVHVHSEVGKGTCIEIFLPLSKNPEINDENRNEKILVLERNLKGQTYLTALLKRLGFEIFPAYDLQEAKTILENYPEMYAIFAEEEILSENPAWEKFKNKDRIIIVSEWNSETDFDPSLKVLKRPYNWTKLKKMLT